MDKIQTIPMRIKKFLKKKLPEKLYSFLHRLWEKYLFWLYLYFYLHKQLVLNYNKDVCYLTVFKSAASSIIATIRNQKNTVKYKKIKNLYIFTFVRNPFSRLYSCYNNKFKQITKEEDFSHNGYSYLTKDFKFIQFYQNDSFATFVKKVARIKDPFSDAHFRSQHCYVYRNNQCLVDYIGRFENLAKDFEPIRKKYNLRKLGHHNKSQKDKDDWKKFYTKELAGLVYQRYKKDCDLWYPGAYKELRHYLGKNEQKNKKVV